MREREFIDANINCLLKQVAKYHTRIEGRINGVPDFWAKVFQRRAVMMVCRG